MENITEFCNSIKNTFAGEKLVELNEVYEELNQRSNKFIQDNSIHCPHGCGTCCEHFCPDITETEALNTAGYLMFISKDKSLLDRLKTYKGGGCPLYNPFSDHHCTVYEARPLICRLFGASANTDKDGNSEFRRCRFNTSDSMPKEIHPKDAPNMADFGLRISTLGESSETELLPQAVLDAVDKLTFIARLIDSNEGGDDDNTPNPSSPVPSAS